MALLIGMALSGLAGAGFVDPLDAPARFSERAARAPIFGLARAGDSRLVAVGQRGHILVSPDLGKTWRQVASPVSVDLTAVHFPTPRIGWIVGHDGVILRSDDGGETWRRVMDGRQIGALLVAHYEKLASAGDASLDGVRKEARRMAEEGSNKSFLSVWFRSEREGWVIGAFNLILHTQDGGATWEPWLERNDNPEAYSLHSIQGIGDDVFIVGERGLVLRLSGRERRFQRITTPYSGSWFAMTGKGSTVIAFGLRGNAWRSLDSGATWAPLATKTVDAINAGACLEDGRLLLVSKAGAILVGADGTSHPLPAGRGEDQLLRGHVVLALTANDFIIGGQDGVRRVALTLANP